MELAKSHFTKSCWLVYKRPRDVRIKQINIIHNEHVHVRLVFWPQQQEHANQPPEARGRVWTETASQMRPQQMQKNICCPCVTQSCPLGAPRRPEEPGKRLKVKGSPPSPQRWLDTASQPGPQTAIVWFHPTRAVMFE